MTNPTPTQHAAGEAEAEHIDLDALEAVAKEATQGAWLVEQLRKNRNIRNADGLYVVWGHSELPLVEDARYIATFDPPTVLALLARLRKAEAASAQSHAQVTRAVAAERERFAKIAAGWWALKGGEDNLFMVNAEPIAAAIRALDVRALVANVQAAEEKP